MSKPNKVPALSMLVPKTTLRMEKYRRQSREFTTLELQDLTKVENPDLM